MTSNNCVLLAGKVELFGGRMLLHLEHIPITGIRTIPQRKRVRSSVLDVRRKRGLPRLLANAWPKAQIIRSPLLEQNVGRWAIFQVGLGHKEFGLGA